MSVLINMEMPTKCGECPCFHAENLMYCQAVKADKNKKITTPYGKPRPDWCPLVLVPEHGRLIDADKIAEHKYTTIPPHRKQYADGKPKSEEEVIAFKFGWNDALEAVIQNAPTIIPAEEG